MNINLSDFQEHAAAAFLKALHDAEFTNPRPAAMATACFAAWLAHQHDHVLSALQQHPDQLDATIACWSQGFIAGFKAANLSDPKHIPSNN